MLFELCFIVIILQNLKISYIFYVILIIIISFNVILKNFLILGRMDFRVILDFGVIMQVCVFLRVLSYEFIIFFDLKKGGDRVRGVWGQSQVSGELCYFRGKIMNVMGDWKDIQVRYVINVSEFGSGKGSL